MRPRLPSRLGTHGLGTIAQLQVFDLLLHADMAVAALARIVEQWVAHPGELRAAGEAAAAYYEAELSRRRGLAAYCDAVAAAVDTTVSQGER